ncbi:UNVERIFIED_CONTAM: hypothetical protein K2H54_031991 [Gekko kuhli]
MIFVHTDQEICGLMATACLSGSMIMTPFRSSSSKLLVLYIVMPEGIERSGRRRPGLSPLLPAHPPVENF